MGAFKVSDSICSFKVSAQNAKKSHVVVDFKHSDNDCGNINKVDDNFGETNLENVRLKNKHRFLLSTV